MKRTSALVLALVGMALETIETEDFPSAQWVLVPFPIALIVFGEV